MRERRAESGSPAPGAAAKHSATARADASEARREPAGETSSGEPGARAGDEFQDSLSRDPRGGAPSGAWRQWLAGGSSREVLARIVQGDPLGVREHVARALREGAWLMDSQRVALRCFALVARHAVRYRGRPEPGEWLQALAREAIATILRDDGEAERKPVVPGHEPGREHGEAFAALSKPLGLEPEEMGRACLAFNRLPQAERAAFFALVIAGRPLDELVRAQGESATEIARRARRALDAILAAAGAAAHENPTVPEKRKTR